MSEFEDDATLLDVMHDVMVMVDNGQVDTDLLGDLELGEIQTAVAAVVSASLSRLNPGDDAELNEQDLRQVVEGAALKAFLTGLACNTSGQQRPGISIPLSAEAMAALVTEIIRDGELSIALVVGG